METPTKSKKTIKLPNVDNLFVSADRLMIELIKTPRKEDDVFVAGDLIWCKMKGFPWWPCMITIDPETGKYSKTVAIRDKNDKAFHVQYFGSKAFRGYTQGNIMKYDSKEAYELKLDQIKNTPTPNKSQRKMDLNNFEIKASFKKDWNLAAVQADEAMKMDRATRIEQLTFEYIVDKPKTSKKKVKKEDSDDQPRTSEKKSVAKSTTKKRKADSEPAMKSKVSKSASKSTTTQSAKRKKVTSAAANNKNTPTDVYDFNEFDDEFDNEDVTPKKPFELSSAKRAKGEYSVYAKQLRASIEKENPDLDAEEIEAKLKHNWELMSDDMRNSYAPRPSLFQSNLSFQLDSPDKSFSSNHEADISIPDLNNSTISTATPSKRKQSKNTAENKKVVVVETKTTNSSGGRRGRKPKQTKLDEKENAEKMQVDDTVVEENGKAADDEQISATNRRGSKKRLLNEGNETNDTTPKRQSGRVKSSSKVETSNNKKASTPSVKTPKAQTPSTRTSTRSTRRSTAANSIDEDENQKVEEEVAEEEEVKSLNHSTKSNSINKKEENTNSNNSNQLINNEEMTNGINLSDDSVSCSSESEDKAEQNQKEDNKEKHCSECLELGKGLVKCDGECKHYYHKECLDQVAT